MTCCHCTSFSKKNRTNRTINEQVRSKSEEKEWESDKGSRKGLSVTMGEKTSKNTLKPLEPTRPSYFKTRSRYFVIRSRFHHHYATHLCRSSTQSCQNVFSDTIFGALKGKSKKQKGGSISQRESDIFGRFWSLWRLLEPFEPLESLFFSDSSRSSSLHLWY